MVAILLNVLYVILAVIGGLVVLIIFFSAVYDRLLNSSGKRKRE